jgi:hypothetical protein
VFDVINIMVAHPATALLLLSGIEQLQPVGNWRAPSSKAAEGKKDSESVVQIKNKEKK